MTTEHDIRRVTAGLDSAFWRLDKKLRKIFLYVMCGGAGYILAHIIAAVLRGAL